MQRPPLSNRVYCPREMMACYARHFPTICVAQGDDGIPSSMLFERVCYPKDMRACQDPRCPNVCQVQGQWHVMLDVVRLYVLSKGHDGMPCPTLSDRVCIPRAMIPCHARRSLILYVYHGR